MTGLAVRGLGVRLGRHEVLRDVTFSCGEPEVIGLIGPNGAGKTTLLRAVAGLLPTSTGAIDLDNAALAAMRERQRGRLVAYLPQEHIVTWPLTARDVVMLGRLPHRTAVGRPSRDDVEIVDQVMAQLDVASFAARPVTRLSGGERCRVLIARALAQRPRLLLADEPTSGLDPAHQIEVMELLRAASRECRIVIVTLHDLSQAARWCDRILVLDDGRLVADASPEDALTDNYLERVFEIEAARLRHDGDLIVVPLRSLRSNLQACTESPPMSASDLKGLLARHLADPDTGWSIGTFGAIAEFHQDPDEPPVVDDSDRLTRATTRGGIRFDSDRLGDVRAIAYETLSPRPHRWSQGVALCLPAGLAERARRSVLTELGPDEEAVRPEDRGAVLFDMGLDLPQIDFCVRTAEPDLIVTLRANIGRSLFDDECTAMAAILRHHPHRVALSNIGRAEVYQKIGGPETDGVSPAGPHTHVLPRLLKTGRTHSANIPIPDGLVPCGHWHPGNPVIGPLGEDRPFDPRLFAAFRSLLECYGSEDHRTAKVQAVTALRNGLAARDYDLPQDRFARSAVRIALRQMARQAECEGDPALAAQVEIWRARVDPTGKAEEVEDDAPGH